MAATENRTQTHVTYQDLLKTGSGTLAGRYLRSFWQPVFHAAALPAGRAKPIRIMSEDLTLYRGEGGAAHLLPFRCAHRGSQLSTGWVEGEDLRCFYHGWKYDASGRCIEQPAEPEPFCNRIKLRGYPVREYLGLIFAYLGGGAPPEFPLLPEFDHPEYVIKHEVSLWPCNYFTQLDNSMDQAHTAIVHWQFQRGVPTVSAQETAGGAVVNVVGSGYRNPSYFMMPNSHEWGSPPRLGGKNKWSYARGWRVPVDDEHHCRFGIDVVPMTGEEAERYRQQQAERWARATRPWMEVADDVIAGRMSPRDLKPEDYPDLVNIQDYIAQVALGPIARQPFPERLGRSDAAVSLVRKIWERELTALAMGRPLTKWRRPDTLWTEIAASGGDLE